MPKVPSYSNRRSQKVRADYLELCRHRIEVEEDDAKRFLPQLLDKQDELLRDLTRVTRQIDLVNARLAAVANARTTRGTPEWIAAEFDRLCQLREIERVNVNLKWSTLTVWTSLLYGEEQDVTNWTRYYELGKFELFIPSLSPLDIRMYNLTHRQGCMDAPYVSDGYPSMHCWGNIASGLAVHLGRREYSVVALMLIQFLTRDVRGGYKVQGWDREVSVEIARPHLAAKLVTGQLTEGRD